MNQEQSKQPIERVMIVRSDDPEKLAQLVGEDGLSQVDPELLRLLEQAPKVASSLRAALQAGQYFISMIWRTRPQPPDDLLHDWHHRGLPETDIVPAMQVIARDFIRVKKAILEGQAGDKVGWS